jgi:cytochrome c-type biogenesis protein CcmH/NrfG
MTAPAQSRSSNGRSTAGCRRPTRISDWRHASAGAILQASRGDNAGAIPLLQAALAADPNLHEARFNLALACARLGRRAEAVAAAQDLLNRLPADAPQRSEVQRLIRSLQ